MKLIEKKYIALKNFPFIQLNSNEKILKSSNIDKLTKNQNNNEDLSFHTLVIGEIIDKINQLQINFFKKKNNSEELFGYYNYTCKLIFFFLNYFLKKNKKII